MGHARPGAGDEQGARGISSVDRHRQPHGEHDGQCDRQATLVDIVSYLLTTRSLRSNCRSTYVRQSSTSRSWNCCSWCIQNMTMMQLTSAVSVALNVTPR